MIGKIRNKKYKGLFNMKKVSKKIVELIGNTPLLELTNYEEANKLDATIIAKLEYFNPLGSVKDRIAYGMIEDAIKEGKIKKDTLIIEPTSGNTGIGLAFVAASKGLKLILTMPDTMSIERRRIVSALGAEVVLTPGSEGMKGAINKAQELASENKNSIILQQFKNKANPEVHRKTTAEEIWRDTDAEVDILIAGVGTGGTVTGIGEALKAKNPNIKVIAVEPASSPVLSGGNPGPHKIQGIGAGFVPDIMNLDIIDEIIKVSNEDAFQASRSVAKLDGVLVGMFSSKTVLDIMTSEGADIFKEDVNFENIKKYIAIENVSSKTFAFVGNSTLVGEIKDIFKEDVENKERINIIFVTQHGKRDEKLLGIITAWEIAAIE